MGSDANTSDADGGAMLPPMRSQSELNLAPIEPWPEPVDGRALLDEQKQYLQRYVVMPKWVAQTVPLWNVHTYAFELRSVSAYLGIESPVKECGKTTLMTLISKLVNRPEVASNISSPAFYRAIEELRPTLLIDEADTLLPGNAQLRGILNSGYTREMAYVLRVTSERVERRSVGASERDKRGSRPPSRSYGGTRLARYSCWGPKAIAQIGHLPDTLRSRCIIIRMQKKMPQEECEPFREDKPLLERLRRQCARFVLDHAAAIATARPELPRGLSDRMVQIWEPLVIVADLAGGDWPEQARQAALGLSASAEENNPVGSLLFGIWLLFATAAAGRMFTRDLVQGLNSLPDRPWGEMTPLRGATARQGKGKGITDAWVADQLQPFGIRPRTMRIGQVQAKGYFEEDFQEAFQRYMSRSEMEALRTNLQAGQARVDSEKKEGAGEQKADPPSSDFGATDPPSSDFGATGPPSSDFGATGPASSDTGATGAAGDDAAAA